MSKIFISYRRNDSDDVTGRIGDRLRLHFGSDNVFTDVDDIPLGVDFRAVLDEAVSQCDVVLVVIGRDWVSSTNAAGQPRLSDPADFVRIEIESALRRDIPVIPLLVRGASMPQHGQLPESIKELAFRNGTPVRSDPDFNNDTIRLIRGLGKHFDSKDKSLSNEINLSEEDTVAGDGPNDSGSAVAQDIKQSQPNAVKDEEILSDEISEIELSVSSTPESPDAAKAPLKQRAEGTKPGHRETTSGDVVEEEKPPRLGTAHRPEAERETPDELAVFRKDLLMATSKADYTRLKYKLDKYLADNPFTVEAKDLQDKTAHALSLVNESDKPTLQRREAPMGHRKNQLWIGAALASVAAVGLYPLVSPKNQERVSPPDIQISLEPSMEEDPAPSAVDSVPSTTTPPIAPTDYIPPDMVRIPAGEFIMGSDSGGYSDEKPAYRVEVPTFELARNELTWQEWQLCEADGGCTEVRRPDFLNDIETSEKERHPVVYVDIESVNEYLSWINEKTGLVYRLPSESEWEYAARAGTTTKYSWGDEIGNNLANCDGCGSAWDDQSTAPVGSFSANPFGLNDMHGNVWEWVADCWHANYDGAPTDGTAWVENCSEFNRSPLRGGSWINLPENLRAANRIRDNTDVADSYVGFRLARTLLP